MSLTATLQERFFRWALRGHAPEPSPVILTQRRVYVLPTRQGLAYAVSLLVMLVGAINYNLSLGYALVFLLTGLGLTAILHTFRNLVQLRIAPGRCEPVFAGELASFGIVLTNRRDETRPAIRLRLPGQTSIEIEVPEQSSLEARLTLPAPHRGWLALPRITLETNYPLGLIRAWSYAAPDQHCLVYPAPAETAPPVPAMPGEDGGAARVAAGMEDFAGLRRHQPADPPRHVAWKAAARQNAGPLLTKLFTGAAAHTLWFDWDMLPTSQDVEARLSVLTRWICDAHGAGLAWGLSLPGSELVPAGDDDHFHACLKLLALYAQE
ncbi:MAG: DUF58 domain-containing protein [Proteobacteria bacterium]|nr:DUF58 domain-containing protein [Pseudomonadota bacterium]